MKRTIFSVLTCVVMVGCGGGGGGGEQSPAINTPTTPVVPPNTPSFSLMVQSRSTHAIPLGGNRVLLANQVYQVGASYPNAFPSFLVWDAASKTITSAFNLSFPTSDLTALVGAGSSLEYSHNLMDLRPSPDGGAILQFDLFGPAATGLGDHVGHVIAKLGSDLSVSWYKVWKTEQYGALEIRSDGYVSTGASLMTYDLNGNLKSNFGLLSTCSVGISNASSVVGTMGGYYVRATDDSLEFKGNGQPSALYAAVTTNTGAAVLAGYGAEANTIYSVVTMTDAQGVPTKSVKLDYTNGSNGFRDITRLAGNFYVLGSRVISATTGNADWVVCKLSETLDSPSCISGRNGTFSSNMSIRADESAGRLYVANHATNAPVMVLAPDLKPIIDPGYKIDNLVATVSPWAVTWSSSQRSPTTVSTQPFSTVLTKTVLAIDPTLTLSGHSFRKTSMKSMV